MKGFQKAYLRGLGQTLRPAVHIGKKGADEALLKEMERALEQQELVKVKFAALKEEKKQLCARLAEQTNSTLGGLVGHTALFYRPHPDPAQRAIRVPERAPGAEGSDEDS
jgi:RNA-binding protein